MQDFEFAIIADGVDTDDETFVDRFFEAGCDDALVMIVKGNVVLQFTREASNVAEAVASAIRDVHRAGARVRRIAPDSYVTISDIAERSGLTRQAISLYANAERGAGDFPRPLLRANTDSPLWDWLSVARWLDKNGKLPDDQSLEFAELVHDLNLHFENLDAGPSSRRNVAKLLEAV
ncbi:MAG: hypothetical protein KBA31_18235 [Alphaproteobacteria bacterium]|nr:hypothetical protein [Alphaproteobacteria bacterium]